MTQLIAFQLLNSFAFAMLLFLLASGFSVIFGVARVANLAHGAFYVVGGYIGLSVSSWVSSFWLGALAATLGGALLGVIVERLMLQRLRGRELDQVLATVGLGFVFADASRLIWGPSVQSVSPPEIFSSPVTVFGMIYPGYSLFVAVLGVVVFALLLLVFKRTSIGARIRAVTADPGMAGALGIPVEWISSLTFAAGVGLAAFGGAIGAPLIALAPGLDSTMTLSALIVVVIGGLGRIEGAFLAALLVGLIDGFGKVFFPGFASFTIYALLVLVLTVRPQGLLGRA
jgi:branched-chain amino acid transport system permease protein